MYAGINHPTSISLDKVQTKVNYDDFAKRLERLYQMSDVLTVWG